MSAVEARFYVAETTEFNGGQSGKVKMSAVSRGDQNAKWASATPCGTIELTINNLPAFEALRAIQRAGKDVRVVLEPVEVLKCDDGHPWRQALNHKGEIEEGVYYYSKGRCGDCGMNKEHHPSHPDFDQADYDRLGSNLKSSP